MAPEVGAPRPVHAERFRQAMRQELEPLRGTWVYDAIARDVAEKTEQVDGGYRRWLSALLPWLLERAGPGPRTILDFGCGTGELAVLMSAAGFDVRGVDAHARHLELARLLAEENGLDASMFVDGEAGRLPFGDGEFAVVTMLSVFEHLEDEVLDWLLPELRRVARLVFALIPNRLALQDDHTGLNFVTWLPRRLALPYIRLRGRRHHYAISRSAQWDVQPRTLRRIEKLVRRGGFDVEFPPAELVFPPLDTVPPVRRIGKRVGPLRLSVPHPYRLLRPGERPEAYHVYLNLVVRPRGAPWPRAGPAL